jgi:hypothetical protein
MYICAISSKQSKLGESAHKIVTEKRTKEYKYPDGKVYATGWEVVKEITVCKEVYDQMIQKGDK